MTTGQNGAYDIILRSTAPGYYYDPVELGLTLYRDGDSSPWNESRISPIPERRSTGEISFSHRDPTIDLIHTQSDWSAGALQTYYASDAPNRYATSSGLDMRWDGVVGLGPAEVYTLSVEPSTVNAFTKSAVHFRDPADGGDRLFAIAGKDTFEFNRTTEVWTSVDTTTVDATDIITWNDAVFVAHGETANIRFIDYSDASPAWADLGTNKATFFTKARNALGVWVLWRGNLPNTLSWSADPTDIGNNAFMPASPLTVGDTGRLITALYPIRNSFIVAKTDGLWLWDPSITNFVDVTTEWDNDVDPLNGSVGAVWHRDLYFTAAQQTLFRYAFNVLEDLSYVVNQPRIAESGGRVTAMLGTTKELLLAITPTTGNAYIARLRLSPQNTWELHTVVTTSMAEVDVLLLDGGRDLHALGHTGTAITAQAWREPRDNTAAFNSAELRATTESGTFTTSIWHGGIPDTRKALLSLTVWGANLDASHTIGVEIRRDGGAWEAVDTFSLTTDVQTIYFFNSTFEDYVNNAVARFLQLRFTFTRPGTDSISPLLYAYELHTQAFFEPIRVWTIDVEVGKTLLKTGVPHELTKTEIESRFWSLERQVFPIAMTENFGHAYDEGSGMNAWGDTVVGDGSRTRLARLTSYDRLPLREGVDDSHEVWRLTLQEALVRRPN